MKIYDNCIRAFVKGNLGDDLFIYTLCKRYPNQKFVICGEEKYKCLFNSISNLKYIAEDSFLESGYLGLLSCQPGLLIRYVKNLSLISALGIIIAILLYMSTAKIIF